MSNSDSPKLPKLSYNNFHFWKSSLKIHASLHDADTILASPVLLTPVDPAAASTYNKKVNKLKALFICTKAQTIPQ